MASTRQDRSARWSAVREAISDIVGKQPRIPHHIVVQGSPRLRQAVMQHLQGLRQPVEAGNLALESPWPHAAPCAQGRCHFRPQLSYLVCR